MLRHFVPIETFLFHTLRRVFVALYQVAKRLFITAWKRNYEIFHSLEKEWNPQSVALYRRIVVARLALNEHFLYVIFKILCKGLSKKYKVIAYYCISVTKAV